MAEVVRWLDTDGTSRQTPRRMIDQSNDGTLIPPYANDAM